MNLETSPIKEGSTASLLQQPFLSKMLSHLPNSWAVYYDNYPTSPANDFSAYQQIPTINSDARALYSDLLAKCHAFKQPTESASSDMNATITDCRYIGSYNWVSNHQDVSIIVPGSPREWQEHPLPYTVPPDILGHYREQYDCRMRSAPLLPLLLAVNHWHERNHHHSQSSSEKYPWHNVDFVTNRNSLRHLLRILRMDNDGSHGTGASGGSKKYHQGGFKYGRLKPFRIDIELAGTKTILLNRWEPTDSEPLYVHSYGFNFESAFTREAEAVSSLDESGETARHHRINSYDFGGLQMVVRSEIDACIPALGDDDGNTSDSIKPLSPSRQCTTEFGLRIIPSPNAPVPQAHLIELSTAKSCTFPTWNAKERYPQLYFSQVPNHYLACHIDGTINQINKRNLHKSPEMVFYAPTIEPKLRMLRKLLEMIQSAVISEARQRERREKRRGGAKWSKSFSLVYCHGRLSLFEREGGRCLPDEAFAMFEL